MKLRTALKHSLATGTPILLEGMLDKLPIQVTWYGGKSFRAWSEKDGRVLPRMMIEVIEKFYKPVDWFEGDGAPTSLTLASKPAPPAGKHYCHCKWEIVLAQGCRCGGI